MALSRAHTSTKAQQSPLIQSTHIRNKTHSRVTIISQNVAVTPQPNCNHKPALTLA